MYSAVSAGNPRVLPIEDWMIDAIRLVLALSGLLIIYLDPVEPDRLEPFTYAALGLYSVYSLFVFVLATRSSKFAQQVRVWSHWGDVVWYALLVALSSGTNSIFFFGFFFAILASSFRHGYKTGLRVTVVSVLLFTIISLATRPVSSGFELNRFLLRPVDLALLGYMISYWGGSQVKLSRRLALLKDVSTLANPRFGFDRTIGAILEQLRSFFNADACLFVAMNYTSQLVLHRADRRGPNAAARAEVIEPRLADALLGLGADRTVIYSGGRTPGWKWRKSRQKALQTGNLIAAHDHKSIEWIANLLDAGWLVSVPVRDHNKAIGRIYLASARSQTFDRADEEFLMQFSEHVVPVLENIRLTDRLAAEAADRERQRIARDIHDSVIQPYIGLQMGLAGVRQRLALEGTDGKDLRKLVTDAASDTERLIEMTADGISDLRSYVSGLKAAANDGLIPGIRRYATKFTQATNITIQVRADNELQVENRIGSEIFQMIVEGLSNIRRHTDSQRGFIGLERADDLLILRIENDGTAGMVLSQFTPRSIAERARSLGGSASVEIFGELGTSVIVEIPVANF